MNSRPPPRPRPLPRRLLPYAAAVALALVAASCATDPGTPAPPGRPTSAATDPNARTGRMLSIASDSPGGPTRRDLLAQVLVETESRVRGAGVNDPETWLQNGVAQFLLAIEEDSEPRLTRSIEALTVATTLDRERPAIREWLARAHEGMGRLNWGVDLAKSREHYRLQAETLKPLSEKGQSGAYRLARVKHADACWHLGEREQALAIYSETHAWAAALPEMSAEEAFAAIAVGAAWQVLAIDAVRAKDLPGALGFFEKAVAMYLPAIFRPDVPTGWRLHAGGALINCARWTALLSVALGESASVGSALAALDQWVDKAPAAIPELPRADLEWAAGVQKQIALLATSRSGAPGTVAARDELRRTGIGLMGMDSALMTSVVRPLLERAMEIHRLLPPDQSEAGIRTSVHLLVESALADAGDGRMEAALDKLRRAEALMPVMTRDDVFLPDRNLVEDSLRTVKLGELSEGQWEAAARIIVEETKTDIQVPLLGDPTPRRVTSRGASLAGTGEGGVVAPTPSGGEPRVKGFYEVGIGAEGTRQSYGVRALLGGREHTFRVTQSLDDR